VIPQLLEQGFMMYQDTHLPVVDLASLLELGNAQVSSSSQLLLVNTVTQPIALHVPKIIGYSELIMRPVSSPISLIPGILGAAVLSSGHPVLLLDPFFMWMNQRSQSAQTLNETFSFTQNTKTGFNHNEDSFVSDASNSPEKQFLDPQKTSGVVNDVHAALTAGGLMAIVQEEQSPKSIASTEEPGMDPLNSILLKTTNNEHEPSSGEAPLILVVDDSATVRHVTKMLLQKQNYRVELASDGLEAWEKLKTIMPAVILLDIEMPKWDGFRLTQAIREDERLKEIPVVMISSRSAQKHSAHAKTIGADMFIGKPFPEDTVLSFVRRAVLNGRRGLKKD
jgi:CheY-like chemotaxis protein